MGVSACTCGGEPSYAGAAYYGEGYCDPAQDEVDDFEPEPIPEGNRLGYLTPNPNFAVGIPKEAAW